MNAAAGPLAPARRGETLAYVRPMLRGQAVIDAQQALMRAGFLGADKVDGLFGPGTRAAVERFQAARGLAATGVVDAAVWDAFAAGPPGAAAPTPKRAMRGGPVAPDALPPARVRRVILHWTAGGGRASPLDLRHYHFVVERDGTVMRGANPIDANDRPASGRYAAHTRRLNTGSVGLAMCGMVGARERPFDPGPSPITEAQFDAICRLAAQICLRYGLDCTPRTVLGHGEVETALGAPQRGKWDPMRLPWRPDATPAEVGALFRAAVAEHMRPSVVEEPPGQPIALRMEGRTAPGALFECAAWIRAADLEALLDQPVSSDPPEGGRMTLRIGETAAAPGWTAAPDDPLRADAPETGWLRVEDLAEQLDLGLSLEDDGAALRLTGRIGGERAADGGAALRAATVMRGDTAWSIAARELGAGARWAELRVRSGAGFQPVDPARLTAGMQVFLPDAAKAAPAAPSIAGLAPALDRLAERIATLSGAGAPAREATPRLIEACLGRGVADPAHLAYVLATAEHETGFGRHMTEIWRDTPAQLRYEANKANERQGDGRRYLGRGYVQLTFRWNYRRFGRALGIDLEGDPELAAQPAVAAQVMAAGMGTLGFCAPKWVLGAYGAGDAFDFDGARRIVNDDVQLFARRYGAATGPAIGARARRYAAEVAAFLDAAAP